jgi:hypothetical protein
MRVRRHPAAAQAELATVVYCVFYRHNDWGLILLSVCCSGSPL